MISYAQNFEDVILNRVFGEKPDGFYIDIGAWDPTVDSVTKHFYELGWSGINVEPATEPYRALQDQRPRDINLRVALGDCKETRDFFEVKGSGLSTFRSDILSDLPKYGFNHAVRPVEVTTLNEVCQTHVSGPIDFMKIDVEGWEEAVIRGGDWHTFRPAVLVVEAVPPCLEAFSDAFPPPSSASGNGFTPVRNSFESLLSGEGYELCFFDGLNEYYLAREALHLREKVSVPANVFDQFLLYRTYEAERELNSAREAQENLRQQLEQCQSELSRREQ